MAAAMPLAAAELPIPRDVVPGPGWTADMREMAAHIGAYETLLISDRHGGLRFYISADPARNPFRDTIGEAKAARFSEIYASSVLTIPKADYALSLARRAPVIAAVRAGLATAAQAARMLNMRRDSVSRLVNRTDEGRGAAALASGAVGALRRRVDERQLDMFSGAVPEHGR